MKYLNKAVLKVLDNHIQNVYASYDERNCIVLYEKLSTSKERLARDIVKLIKSIEDN